MITFNKTFSGKIPEKLRYVQRPAREVTDYWEHDFWAADENKRPGVFLRETFVVDVESEKSLETAKSWAERATQEYDHETRKYKKTGKIDITERDNDPIPTLEIVSLDVRSEGGRAWKVLIHGIYYVDLREDVMLDCLRNGCKVENAELQGPFRWVQVAGRLKLARVGSVLYQAVEEANKRHHTKNVAKGALVLGGIYENRKGERAVYLGNVDRTTYEVTNPDEVRNRSNGWSGKQADAKFAKKTERNLQLWYEIPKHSKGGLKDLFVPNDDRHGGSYYHRWNTFYLKMVKTRSVTGLVDTTDVPLDLIEQLRKMAKDNHDATVKYNSQFAHRRDSADDIRQTLAYGADQALLVRAGEAAIPVPEYLKPLDDYASKA